MNENSDVKDIKMIPGTPFAYFLHASKPFKWWAFSALFIVILASALSQGTAYFFKLVVDAVEAKDFEAALLYVLLFPVVVFAVHLLYRASGYTGLNWIVRSEKYGYDILSKHVMQHSHSYFTSRFAGSIMSKINNVNSSVDRLIGDFLWTYTTAFVSLVVTIVFLLLIDVRSALAFITLIVVLLIFNRKIAPKQAQYAETASSSQTNLRARLVDTISNIQAVRQYVQEKTEGERVEDYSEELKKNARKSYMYMEWTFFWNGFIMFIFSLLMFWFLFLGWQSGAVSTGDMVLILALYSQITGTLIFIGRAFNSGARAVGEIKEGLEELLVPYEIVDHKDAKPLKVDEANITWQNVIFNFENKNVFSDFNIEIPAGERIGLVGQSGAGKTTFVSLLLRQHNVDAGKISIAGQDISKVTQESLRRAISVVPQEPVLFHRSIKENILYGKPEASDDEVIAVAKKAQAHDFIMELPEKYDTLVGERGVKLSGGQKQRVAIARAMLKDSPILLLDEATSALDSESEVAIQKALETLMEGRTVIAVAHRLSTLRKMDRIIVMEAGQVIEDGNHKSLSQAGGVYERLWNHQAGGFLLDPKGE
jgi:ATP-binding cassette subfamily B protein